MTSQYCFCPLDLQYTFSVGETPVSFEDFERDLNTQNQANFTPASFLADDGSFAFAPPTQKVPYQLVVVPSAHSSHPTPPAQYQHYHHHHQHHQQQQQQQQHPFQPPAAPHRDAHYDNFDESGLNFGFDDTINMMPLDSSTLFPPVQPPAVSSSLSVSSLSVSSSSFSSSRAPGYPEDVHRAPAAMPSLPIPAAALKTSHRKTSIAPCSSSPPLAHTKIEEVDCSDNEEMDALEEGEEEDEEDEEEEEEEEEDDSDFEENHRASHPAKGKAPLPKKSPQQKSGTVTSTPAAAGTPDRSRITTVTIIGPNGEIIIKERKKPGRKPKILDEETKKVRGRVRQEKNRVAARKCREKKQGYYVLLEDEVIVLRQNKEDMTKEIAMLRQELQKLQAQFSSKS